MKIGLVTLHEHNYGSALQCFASQEFLKQRGLGVEVINQVPEYSLLKRYGKRLWALFKLCACNPSSTKKIFSLFNSQRGSSLRITQSSESAITRFNSGYINNAYYTPGGLKSIGDSSDYVAFLSGSDQVWNGSRIDFYDLYFLRFAPITKRVSWAASFGANTIAPYNRKRYAKYIREYNKISVREKSAIDIVHNLTDKEAVCLADPVILLNGSQWRTLYKINAKKQAIEEKYILLFFLDKPSDLALRSTTQLSKQTGLRVVTFGYKQSEIEDHKDGGPWEFLSMIDGAEFVITDSFHAMVFSLLFHKRFFVFDRQYVHKQSQASRIVDLLNSIGLIDRFEPSITPGNEPDFCKADYYFEKAGKAYTSYYLDVFKGLKNSENKEIITVKDYLSQCCGCGACADICHVKAITMTCDKSGHTYPHIDTNLCTGCNACRKICAFKIWPLESDIQQDGYVACGRDEELIKKSASGGAFATFAKRTIEQGGVVYGASLWIEKEKVKCEHIAVEKIEDLYKIQGSKYIQSKTDGVFNDIRERLKDGKSVLFGGTSCQVANLKSFLRKDYDNLLTIDLICHGVPSLSILQDYLNYQKGVYNEEIIDFRFRVREGRNKPYLITTTTRDSKGNIYQHRVGLRDSAFYRLFMGRGGYRSSCYSCPFASVNKPADLTIGDYYPQKGDGGIIAAFPKQEMLSTVIVHTNKGECALKELNDVIHIVPRNIKEFIKGHEQLHTPSQITADGKSLFAIYEEQGFEGVQKAVNKRNFEMIIPSLMKKVSNLIKNK